MLAKIYLLVSEGDLEESELVVSISQSNPEVVAEYLFNFRNGELLGISPRIRWPESRLDSVVQDGVAVRAYPDRYCSTSPCLSLFIEREEGGYFSELEGATVRLFALAPRIGSSHGIMRCIHRGAPVATGQLVMGKVEFSVPLFKVVYVEVVRQNMSLINSSSPLLATAG